MVIRIVYRTFRISTTRGISTQRFRNSVEKLGEIGEERQRLEGVEKKVVQGKVDEVFRLLVFRD